MAEPVRTLSVNVIGGTSRLPLRIKRKKSRLGRRAPQWKAMRLSPKKGDGSVRTSSRLFHRSATSLARHDVPPSLTTRRSWTRSGPPRSDALLFSGWCPTARSIRLSGFVIITVTVTTASARTHTQSECACVFLRIMHSAEYALSLQWCLFAFEVFSWRLP